METILITFQNIFYVKGKFKPGELIMTALSVYMVFALWLIASKESANNVTFLTLQLLYFASQTSAFIACYRSKMAHPGALGQAYFAAMLLTALLWNILFFRFHSVNVAFSVSIVNLVFLIATYFDFDKYDKRAGILMLPAVAVGLIVTGVNFFAI